MNPMETVDVLTRLIKMQADIINELFTLLMQHISAAEADSLPVVKRINEAAGIRADLSRQGL